MADRYKILAQLSLTASGLTSLYSVPVPAATTAGTGDEIDVAPKATSIHVQTLVTSVIVCNDAAATAGTFDLQLVAAATATAPLTDTSWLFKLNPLSANATKALSLGLVLSPGDEIFADVATTDCDFTLMGIEIVTGGGPNA